MIKIIIPGKQEFIATCNKCGCKFSYELSDLKKDITHYAFDLNVVECPCCKERYIHPFHKEKANAV